MALSALPRGAVPVSAEVQIGVRTIETPGQRGELSLHVGLERRLAGQPDAAFCPTAAGFRVPLHLVPLLIDELKSVASRAAEAQLWAPPAEQEPSRG